MENLTNKKIERLKKRHARYVKDVEKADEDIKWWYKTQVDLIDYDLENAVKNEAKRRTRLALKHINKKLNEVKELRETVDGLLDDDVLGWTERMTFEEELEKVFDLRRLRFGER